MLIVLKILQRKKQHPINYKNSKKPQEKEDPLNKKLILTLYKVNILHKTYTDTSQ